MIKNIRHHWTLKTLGKFCFKNFINSYHNETTLSVLLDIVVPIKLSYHKGQKMLDYITGIKN